MIEPVNLGSFGDITVRRTCVEKALRNEQCFPYFIREVSSLKLLNSADVPCVVQLQDVMDNGTIKLEKFDGDLLDYLPTTFNDVYRMTYQLLVTMCNMSQLHITHRDIKPDNVLTMRDGKRIALCDFGLTRYFSESEVPDQTTPSVQTAQYRSPELIFSDLEGYDTFNPENLDIWSLGVTVLQMLELEDMLPPLPDDNMTLGDLEDKYIAMYGSDTFSDEVVSHALESGISDEFIYLIKCMLTMDYKTRPDPMSILSDAFFDPYRGDNDDIIDGVEFNQSRVRACVKIITEIDQGKHGKLDTGHIETISHCEYIHDDSQHLALLLYCKLHAMGKSLDEKDIIAVIGISAAVFDSDLVEVTIPHAVKILKDLNYDLFLPVRDCDVRSGLDKLFNTV
jgi:serine/threonine protein kinase